MPGRRLTGLVVTEEGRRLSLHHADHWPKTSIYSSSMSRDRDEAMRAGHHHSESTTYVEPSSGEPGPGGGGVVVHDRLHGVIGADAYSSSSSTPGSRLVDDDG